MTRIAHTILNVSTPDVAFNFYDKLMEELDVPRRIVHEDEEDKIVAYQIPHSPIYIKFSKDSEKKNSFVM